MDVGSIVSVRLPDLVEKKKLTRCVWEITGIPLILATKNASLGRPVAVIVTGCW